MSQDGDFEKLLDQLARTRGFDFTGYKRASLMRRVSKRMHEVGVEGFAEYTDYLEVHPEEFEALFNTILINVTSFFRDREAWDLLATDVVPRALEARSGEVRVWCAGCAGGQEAYSVAMTFAEPLGPEAFVSRVKIYATDVDEDALAEARRGSYDAKAMAGVPDALVERYFQSEDGRFAFRKDLRRSIIFGRNDLVQDAPISRVDLLLCRNTLMYFHAETQERIVARFHFALNPGGVLFLGRSEMLTRHADLFAPMDPDERLFTKVAATRRRDEEAPVDRGDGFADRLREAAVDALPVAQVLIDDEDRIVAMNHAARWLFGLGDGDVGRPLRDLTLSYRPAELRSAVDQIRRERQPLELGEVTWTMPGGESRRLEVRLAPVLAGGDGFGISIVFNDVTRYHRLTKDLATSKNDTEHAYQALQSTSEELETTNEELQSTNEELETTNEELQSTNEELETTNEELQSTNEELGALNDQLRDRTDEVDSVNDYLEGVLTSLPSSVVVVDRDLTVRMWNRQSEELWGLRAGEVRGRQLLGLDIGLPLDHLGAPIRACLAGEDKPEPLTVAAVNRRGRPIQVRVSCRLLATAEGPGGVIVLLDASETE